MRSRLIYTRDFDRQQRWTNLLTFNKEVIGLNQSTGDKYYHRERFTIIFGDSSEQISDAVRTVNCWTSDPDMPFNNDDRLKVINKLFRIATYLDSIRPEQ